MKKSFLASVAIISVRKIFTSVLVCATLITAPTAKANSILQEIGVNFSNNWVSPTIVTSDMTGVAGTGAPEWMGGDRLDIFQFSGLLPGAASIVFNFSLTEPYRADSYQNGGGSIYYSYVPFSGAYYVDQGNGKVLGSQDLLAGNFNAIYNPWEAANGLNRGTSSFTLNLTKEFTGNLFLALDFTYGQVSYNINSLAWAISDNGTLPMETPTAIPVPATGLLLLIGFVGLATNCRKHN